MKAETQNQQPKLAQPKVGMPQVNWPYLGRIIWRGAAGMAKFAERVIMGLVSNVFGAAVLAGALAGPGAYYMFQQQNEYVTAKVTGRVQADTDSKYPGEKYFIYTDNSSKLDTFSLAEGASLREGCRYRFNLKGARIQTWPPSYSRSIVRAEKISCP